MEIRNELEVQGFLSEDEPTPEKFDPPTNAGGLMNKPEGGLWTSTLRDDGTCAWLEWCRAESWGLTDETKLYALEPASDIAVLEIDSFDDLQELLYQWRRKNIPPALERFAPLDFEAMAHGIDAIHLTKRGERKTRYSTPGLYGWDCECTLWLQWAFNSVECLGTIEP